MLKRLRAKRWNSPESDQNMMQTAGLLDLKLLSDTKMDATHSKLSDGQHKIFLNYSGWGALNVDLLGSTFMIFQLPQEIVSAISGDIVAKYDVPKLIGRNTGEFENILIEKNQVILDFKSLLSIIIGILIYVIIRLKRRTS